ncbi:hypothetical protein PHEL85_0418 [Polaribacter sp. Hel1_85]|nr:hypothetical protein PHEL85_0418 [Polaribacter sp. Hel1_85]
MYLLFVPVVLFVATTTNQYYVHIKGLAKVSAEYHSEEILRVKLEVFF